MKLKLTRLSLSWKRLRKKRRLKVKRVLKALEVLGLCQQGQSKVETLAKRGAGVDKAKIKSQAHLKIQNRPPNQ